MTTTTFETSVPVEMTAEWVVEDGATDAAPVTTVAAAAAVAAAVRVTTVLDADPGRRDDEKRERYGFYLWERNWSGVLYAFSVIPDVADKIKKNL